MENPSIGLSIFGILGIAALVLTNAYFVAAEFSLVATRRSQVEIWLRDGRRGSQAVAEALDNLDDAIAACQLGITLASLGLGWIAEPALARQVELGLTAVGVGAVSETAVHTIAVTIVFFRDHFSACCYWRAGPEGSCFATTW